MKFKKMDIITNGILWGLCIVAVILSFIFQIVKISGLSMYPTYDDKQLVFINKIEYKKNDPVRNDIIVFKNNNQFLIKRIIGLPGETVQIDSNGTIYINNKEYVDNGHYETIKDPGLAINKITLNENEYFVLGDNRNNSIDSRSKIVGIVKRNMIKGKVIVK